VKTCPSMRPDMTSTAGIHDRLAAKGLLPAEHLYQIPLVRTHLPSHANRWT
jgi:hypothetical protein